MPKEQRMRTTQACAHVCTATNSPVVLPGLTGLTDCSHSPISDALVFIAEAGKGSLVVRRHLDSWEAMWSPERAGAWFGTECRHDATGTEFRREIRLVEDDHGELVEVSTC